MRTSTATLPTIRELLGEAAATLPEPFSRTALINWISARRPDVAVPSIAAHIQSATDNAGRGTRCADRPPLLHRVGRGTYLRYRPAGAAVDAREVATTPRVVLLGSAAGSPGFLAARDSAVRAGDRWFALSARHGLLDPGDGLGDAAGELPLGDHSLGYRIAWGEWVAAQLAERMWLTGLVAEVHGGVDFAQPLRAPLARRGAGVEIPLPRSWQEEPAGDLQDDGGRHRFLGNDVRRWHIPGVGTRHRRT